MLLYNSTYLFKPVGGHTFYTLDGTPYLHVELGRYAQPEDDAAVVGADICGDWYLAEFVYEKEMCLFFDAVNTRTGKRAIHNTYTEQDLENGEDPGFFFRYDGETYRISYMNFYVQDNVLYWSRFSDDGSTTIFKITLK